MQRHPNARRARASRVPIVSQSVSSRSKNTARTRGSEGIVIPRQPVQHLPLEHAWDQDGQPFLRAVQSRDVRGDRLVDARRQLAHSERPGQPYAVNRWMYYKRLDEALGKTGIAIANQ